MSRTDVVGRGDPFRTAGGAATAFVAFALLVAACGSSGGGSAPSAEPTSTSLPNTVAPPESARTTTPSRKDAEAVARRIVHARDPEQHFELIEGPVIDSSGAGSVAAAVARRSPSGDGRGQVVLVWHDGTFFGLAEPFEVLGVQSIRVEADEVVVRYLMYGNDDPLCCPSQPPIEVRYRWSGDGFVGSIAVPEAAYRVKIMVRLTA